jgi:hypothetical protein
MVMMSVHEVVLIRPHTLVQLNAFPRTTTATDNEIKLQAYVHRKITRLRSVVHKIKIME